MTTRRALKWAGWILLGAFLSDAFGFVKFTYPHVTDNVRLNAPRTVAAIEGDAIRFRDGEVYRVAPANTGITGGMHVYVRMFGNEVGLEETAIAGQFIMSYKRCTLVCGTPWAAVLTIPLIPISVTKTYRVDVAVVKANDPRTAPPAMPEARRP